MTERASTSDGPPTDTTRVGRLICAVKPPPLMNCCRPGGRVVGVCCRVLAQRCSRLLVVRLGRWVVHPKHVRRLIRCFVGHEVSGQCAGSRCRPAATCWQSSPDSRTVPSSAGWSTPSGRGRPRATAAVVVLVVVAVGGCAGCGGGRAARRALTGSPSRGTAPLRSGCDLAVGDPSRSLVVWRSRAGVAMGGYRAGGPVSGGRDTGPEALYLEALYPEALYLRPPSPRWSPLIRLRASRAFLRRAEE